MRARIKDLTRYRKNGITKLAECQEYDEQRLRRERRKENKRKMVGGTQPRRTNVSMGKKNEASSEDKDEKDRSLSSPSFEDQMKNCPTYNLLSLMERQLCASMHMKPGFYLTIKTIVLKDNLLRRQGVQVKTRYPPNLDKTHRKHIMNFLKESGWVATS